MQRKNPKGSVSAGHLFLNLLFAAGFIASGAGPVSAAPVSGLGSGVLPARWGLWAQAVRRPAPQCNRFAAIRPAERAECVRPLALSWAQNGLAAVEHLQRYLAGRIKRTRQTELAALAFAVHFKANYLDLMLRRNLKRWQPGIEVTRIHFKRSIGLFNRSHQIFQNAPANYRRVHNVDQDTPAYAFRNRVWFTPLFALSEPVRPGRVRGGYGRPALAAMVVHEVVHLSDPHSGLRSIHVSEFQPAYNRQTHTRAIHNPSSYNAFGQYVCYGQNTMYGAGHRVRHVQKPPRRACRHRNW